MSKRTRSPAVEGEEGGAERPRDRERLLAARRPEEAVDDLVARLEVLPRGELREVGREALVGHAPAGEDDGRGRVARPRPLQDDVAGAGHALEGAHRADHGGGQAVGRRRRPSSTTYCHGRGSGEERPAPPARPARRAGLVAQAGEGDRREDPEQRARLLDEVGGVVDDLLARAGPRARRRGRAGRAASRRGPWRRGPRRRREPREGADRRRAGRRAAGRARRRATAPPSRGARPRRAGARPSVSRVTRTRSRGARTTLTVSPPWPRARAAVARARRAARRGGAAARGARRARSHATPSPSSEVRAEEDLEEGHGRGLERGEGQVAAAARLLEAGERDEGAQRRGRGRGRPGWRRRARAAGSRAGGPSTSGPAGSRRRRRRSR